MRVLRAREKITNERKVKRKKKEDNEIVRVGVVHKCEG